MDEISICCSVASLHPQFLGQLVQFSILCLFSPVFQDSFQNMRNGGLCVISRAHSQHARFRILDARGHWISIGLKQFWCWWIVQCHTDNLLDVCTEDSLFCSLETCCCQVQQCCGSSSCRRIQAIVLKQWQHEQHLKWSPFYCCRKNAVSIYKTCFMPSILQCLCNTFISH
jgi:hypothetical protein